VQASETKPAEADGYTLAEFLSTADDAAGKEFTKEFLDEFIATLQPVEPTMNPAEYATTESTTPYKQKQYHQLPVVVVFEDGTQVGSRLERRRLKKFLLSQCSTQIDRYLKRLAQRA
jgi:hypothetical protein